MTGSYASRGGMEGRGVSPSIAAQIECPELPFVRCKQSSFSRFPLLPFQSLSRPVWGVGFDATSKQGV